MKNLIKSNIFKIIFSLVNIVAFILLNNRYLFYFDKLTHQTSRTEIPLAIYSIRCSGEVILFVLFSLTLIKVGKFLQRIEES